MKNRKIIIFPLIIFLVSAIVIVNSYLKLGERTPSQQIIRNAVSAEPELSAWLRSAKNQSKNTRENDTDGNGIIDNKDLTDSELAQEGVCTQFVRRENKGNKATSPWNKNIELWTTDTKGQGQIACNQNGLTIQLLVFDQNGHIIHASQVTPAKNVKPRKE